MLAKVTNVAFFLTFNYYASLTKVDPQMDENKTNLIDAATVLFKWRVFISRNFLIICIITAGFTLIAPKTFTASTTFLPPVGDDDVVGFSTLLNNLPLGGFGFGKNTAQVNLYMAILNSREVLEDIALKFGLQARYDAEDMEKTVKEMRERMATSFNDDGTLSLAFNVTTGFMPGDKESDEIRELSAEITNFMVQTLDARYRELKAEQAKNNREFVETRYIQAQHDLAKAEVAFKEFQDEHGVVALSNQTEATIATMSRIKAGIMVKETELGLLSKYMESTHQYVQKSKTELALLRKQYEEIRQKHKLESGDHLASDGNVDFLIPFAELPELGLKYVRLFREIKLQEKLQEFLLPLYEQAKIQEARSSPTVQVLDHAVPPILRTSPKRTITVLVMGFLSLLFSFVWIAISEYLASLRQSDVELQKVLALQSGIRNDINRLLRRKPQDPEKP